MWLDLPGSNQIFVYALARIVKIILDVVLYVFYTLDLDASFEAAPLEESIKTVGKSHLCDCGYATVDKSNFNKHMKRCM